ncbi:MAG: TrkH family potassium uptake protein [Boseongicola sp.]
MERLARLPLIVILVGLGALAMQIPALHAYSVRDLEVARAFLYSGLLGMLLFGMLAIAASSYRIRRQGRSHLISILLCFAVLPVMLAVPFSESVPDTRFFNAYVEMVSSLTTTGMTLFDAERLPPSLHLWRALVGWLGGFFVWVTAIAILAPLSLGGFEVVSSDEVGRGASGSTVQLDRVANPSERLLRYSLRLAPVYGGLTLILWVALIMSGDTPLIAVTHAMAVLSTSGISPVGGAESAPSGLGGEALIFVFFVFALSRVTFTAGERQGGWRKLWDDPELRIGFALIVVLPALLFFRHWATTFEEGTAVSLVEGFRGLWGALFTVASFLTTTGFVSDSWGAARAWSGLSSPGIVLMGLAVLGGGVATTAGGVKLLRVVALYKHGVNEMNKLVLPSMVGGAGQTARHFRRQGAYIAWIFFMLFALSVAGVAALLALAGLSFDEALIMTVATLSTTGPLTEVAADAPLRLDQFNDMAKAIAAAAMVLGRLETLAIIALLNPEFWR